MLGALLLLLQANHPRPLAPAPKDRPALAVLIVVDQMRPDYFTRYDRQFVGGFRRVLDQGTLFLDGRQDHAMTETAPGHSTLLSGRFPSSTGIVANDAGVSDSSYRIVGGGSGNGASPLRFQGSTLYDWLLAKDPATRVLSISRKDRSAILPIGRAKRDIYWWTAGRWGTSRYYADSLPSWLQRYNTRAGWRNLLGTTWTPLLPDSAYPEPDSVTWEHNGKDFTFPHALPDDSTRLASRIVYYPWMDSLTIDLALEGTHQLGLGTRSEGPDLLVVSLSTTDRMGHDFGPDSKELHDHLLRLDRWFGWFQDSLAHLVPDGRITYALTADHGTQHWVEWTLAQGRPAARPSMKSMLAQLRDACRTRWGTDFGLAQEGGLLYGDTAAMHARRIDLTKLADSLARVARTLAGAQRVYTPRTLAPSERPDARIWRRAIPPSQGWLIAVSLNDGYVWDHSDHGGITLQDQQVPIAFWGTGVGRARPARTVSTTDIAPTLAALLGVRPTEPISGIILPEIVAPSRHRTPSPSGPRP